MSDLVPDRAAIRSQLAGMRSQLVRNSLYTEAAVATGAALTTERAIALAGELIAAGLRRLR